MSVLIPRRIPWNKKPPTLERVEKAGSTDLIFPMYAPYNRSASGVIYGSKNSAIDIEPTINGLALVTPSSYGGRPLDISNFTHTGSFTIEVFLRKLGDLAADAVKYLFDSSSGRLVAGSNGGTNWEAYDGAWKTTSPAVPIVDDINHVFFIFSGGNLRVFNNNLPSGDVAFTNNNIGGSTTFFSRFDGLSNTQLTNAEVLFAAIHTRALSDAEVVDRIDNPYHIYQPRRRWVPVVIQGGATVSVGLASELSTAQAISRQKQKAVGLSAETDTALATTPAKVTAIGLSTETDAAFSILRSKIKAAGLSTETDSAFALIISSAVNVGLSAETDSALAISRLKQNPVGLSTETDTALSVNRSKIKIAGLGIETDVAFTISRSKLKELGLSSEIDEALAISSAGSVAVGLASELDVALVIGRLKQQVLGLSTETDLSQTVNTIKTQQAGLSTESDTALVITGSSGRVVGLATETDLAQSISRIKQKLIGLAPETDVALAITIAGVTVVINTNAKETLKLLAENPTLTLS